MKVTVSPKLLHIGTVIQRLQSKTSQVPITLHAAKRMCAWVANDGNETR